jgi:hypothetical protein
MDGSWTITGGRWMIGGWTCWSGSWMDSNLIEGLMKACFRARLSERRGMGLSIASKQVLGEEGIQET